MPGPKRTALIEKIAVIMKAAEPTPFAAEGPCRAGIRESLCLAGVGWRRADAEAADVTEAALRQVGARRPTWQEGQPEYSQPGVLPILRERCIHCAKPLPEGHFKYCSDICGASYQSRLRNLRCTDETRAKNAAAAAARTKAWSEKQPPRRCEGCGGQYKPKSPKQKFCCVRCSHKTVSGVRSDVF